MTAATAAQAKGEGNAGGARLGRALDRGEDADSVSGPIESAGPRRPEHGVVSIDEAGEIVGRRVGVRYRRRELIEYLCVVADRSAYRPRILEILVEDEDVRAERRSRRRGQQRIVRRGRAENSGESTVPEYRLPDRAVRATRAGEVQSRNACVIESRRGAQDILAVTLYVPRNS